MRYRGQFVDRTGSATRSRLNVLRWQAVLVRRKSARGPNGRLTRFFYSLNFWTIRSLSGAVSMSGAGNRARARARIHISIERMVGNWPTAAAIKPS
jgi:hypothetical protein